MENLRRRESSPSPSPQYRTGRSKNVTASESIQNGRANDSVRESPFFLYSSSQSSSKLQIITQLATLLDQCLKHIPSHVSEQRGLIVVSHAYSITHHGPKSLGQSSDGVRREALLEKRGKGPPLPPSATISTSQARVGDPTSLHSAVDVTLPPGLLPDLLGLHSKPSAVTRKKIKGKGRQGKKKKRIPELCIPGSRSSRQSKNPDPEKKKGVPKRVLRKKKRIVGPVVER